MKNFKVLVIVFLFGTMGLFANNIENPKGSSDDIRSQIIELLGPENSILSAETYVNIIFTFSTEGEIVVLKVESTDKEVLAFIRENLNYKKIENPGKVNKEYMMPISVKPMY
jgi:hypothetical protein